jgi:ribosome-associated protein
MTEDEKPRLPRDLKRRLGRKDANAADALADVLLKTRPAVFDALPLNAETRKALAELRAMRVEKERARQLRYVQRLVRESDRDAIEAALAASDNDADAEAKQRRAEHLADTILANGDGAIDDVIEDMPSLDRTTLRNLARNVKKASEKDAPRARRALVAEIRNAPPAVEQDED